MEHESHQGQKKKKKLPPGSSAEVLEESFRLRLSRHTFSVMFSSKIMTSWKKMSIGEKEICVCIVLYSSCVQSDFCIKSFLLLDFCFTLICHLCY